jgi:hypothetical protein
MLIKPDPINPSGFAIPAIAVIPSKPIDNPFITVICEILAIRSLVITVSKFDPIAYLKLCRVFNRIRM